MSIITNKSYNMLNAKGFLAFLLLIGCCLICITHAFDSAKTQVKEPTNVVGEANTENKEEKSSINEEVSSHPQTSEEVIDVTTILDGVALTKSIKKNFFL